MPCFVVDQRLVCMYVCSGLLLALHQEFSSMHHAVGTAVLSLSLSENLLVWLVASL